ncbi:MAG: hypothetical protein AAB638_01595, partial [Patescibacteria group bacterium]
RVQALSLSTKQSLTRSLLFLWQNHSLLETGKHTSRHSKKQKIFSLGKTISNTYIEAYPAILKLLINN